MQDVSKLAQKDWNKLSQQVDLNFISHIDQVSVNVKGLASLHHLSIDFETGRSVNSKNGHASVSEVLLTDLNYTTRNAKGEVDMIGDFLTWIDSTGVSKKYIIDQSFPSDTTGMIVFILGKYNG